LIEWFEKRYKEREIHLGIGTSKARNLRRTGSLNRLFVGTRHRPVDIKMDFEIKG
jgi:ribosomal protein L25 (general stress protein Ctc)